MTLIAGTPSFTRFYIKACAPEQFKTLDPPGPGGGEAQARALPRYAKWLDIEPMEGYGITELSPVVAVNVPREMVLADGRTIHGNRPGTVGLPVPGR